MISARRVALLGIGFPLSPVMIAVLGLWPDEAPYQFGGAEVLVGSGGQKRKPDSKPKSRQTEIRKMIRLRRQNELILSLVMAAMTEELL